MPRRIEVAASASWAKIVINPNKAKAEAGAEADGVLRCPTSTIRLELWQALPIIQIRSNSNSRK